MNRRTFTAAALATALLAAAAAGLAAAQETAAPADDADFVSKAAVGGSTEVALSKMALERASDPEVKTFARRMVTDHTSANEKLLTLAGRKRINVPRTIDAKHQQALDRIARTQGSDFDKAYTKQMVTDHEETVTLFKNEASNGKDPDLKAFANQLLPTLQDHLKMARRLNGDKDASVGVTGAERPKK